MAINLRLKTELVVRRLSNRVIPYLGLKMMHEEQIPFRFRNGQHQKTVSPFLQAKSYKTLFTECLLLIVAFSAGRMGHTIPQSGALHGHEEAKL